RPDREKRQGAPAVGRGRRCAGRCVHQTTHSRRIGSVQHFTRRPAGPARGTRWRTVWTGTAAGGCALPPEPQVVEGKHDALAGATAVAWGYSWRRKATRAAFSRAGSCTPRTGLKNSTVSSSVSSRPSCRYGGESLMPRRVKVLIGPSACI